VCRPIIGGFAAQYKSWQWTQWSMIFIALAAFLIALPMRETYKPIILARRAKKHGIIPPADPAAAKVKTAIALKVVRPLHMLCTEVRISQPAAVI
jgi:MFS family permease